MQENFKPSKQFLIRGGVAVITLTLILIIQTDWFRALFNKQPLPPISPNTTIGELTAKDTNGNGITDWEEKLWGLDPTALYTDGVPNKTIIEQKKLALGITDSTEPENETDALARELFSITAALGDSGQLTDEELATVGERLADSVEFGNTVNTYSLKDVRTVSTTTTSLNAYYNNFSTLAAKHADMGSEIETFVQALETGDTSSLYSFSMIQNDYDRYARELIALEVPIGVQKTHLDITNSIYGLSMAVKYMGEFADNGANALAGVTLYKIHDARLVLATNELHAYFVKYGILNQ